MYECMHACMYVLKHARTHACMCVCVWVTTRRLCHRASGQQQQHTVWEAGLLRTLLRCLPKLYKTEFRLIIILV